MKLCLLTYDAPHLKTAQVFAGLHARGFRRIDFLLMPFVPRPRREVLFAHRPEQFGGGPDPHELAARSGGRTFPYEEWRVCLGRYDRFLVCGSNLIEADFAASGKVLNVHAGLIPAVRGLDSFKWAILRGDPLGNTLHVVDAEVDAGTVLAHMPTPVKAGDTLQSLAARHYGNEIQMLTHFNQVRGTLPGLSDAEPTRRMPLEVEAEMIARFDAYLVAYAGH